MGAGIGGAGVGLLVAATWIVPLATLAITVVLGIRLVRAAERLAVAMEQMARNNLPPRG